MREKGTGGLSLNKKKSLEQSHFIVASEYVSQDTVVLDDLTKSAICHLDAISRKSHVIVQEIKAVTCNQATVIEGVLGDL